jgi:hypothetical protein
MFLTRVHDRFLPTGLADLIDPTSTGLLHTAATQYRQAIDALARHSRLAA